MYSIFKNDKGELALLIGVQPSDPDEPMLIYDGGDMAVLFRDWGSTIALDNLDESVRPVLKESKEIRVIEAKGEDFVRDYSARIRIVRNVRSMINT